MTVANLHLTLFCLLFALARIGAAQEVSYSPAFFGPNALPVPEFANADITKHTFASLSQNYFSGQGDQTHCSRFDVEVPLLPERISLKLWAYIAEYYDVTQEIYDLRQMEQSQLHGNFAVGDIYVQTRFSVLSETEMRPAVVVNSTLKSASGNEFKARRHYDTPGYYFDMEVVKSLPLDGKHLKSIRFAANLGFLCWETTNSVQNDAYMYGSAIILSSKQLDVETAIGGYSGWMNNGDKPVVVSSKLIGRTAVADIFLQYKYGIRDWRYHHLAAGLRVYFQKLTPRYEVK
jgi:hypothetical protein